MKKIPHTYVIIFFIILISAILTWIIPGGEFQREQVVINGAEREVVVTGSFEYTDSNPQTWQVFSALFQGFVNTSNIIVFVLLIGGAFWIMNYSRAIDQGIQGFLKSSKRLERFKPIRFLGVDNIIIFFIMLLFSVFGAVFGMSEETIAFMVIFVPLAISMGYDSITGTSLVFVAAGLGFAGAILNPFTVGIAQGLSDIPLYSGMGYRLFCWIIITLVGIVYVMIYARKIKKNPKKSLVYQDDEYWRKLKETKGDEIENTGKRSGWAVYILITLLLGFVAFRFPTTELSAGNQSVILPVMPFLAGLFALMGPFSLRKSSRGMVLQLLLFTILFLVVGVMGYGWYIKEIATLFFAMGIFSGIVMGYSPNKITKLFLDGSKDILSAAMVVGLAGGIIVILQEGHIIDTILYGVSKAMNNFGRMATVGMMYVFQTFLNVIIPSGSGKAALTMPLMSQFSDLVGLSRQATVMAFQFGDGFTNMITPTSGVLIGVLGVARIPYQKWVKWIVPLMM